MPDQAVAGEQVTNDQQFGEPTKDIRSELYSLGVTLYFLLTGIALSTEALHRGPKFSGFPKPLLVLLGRLLHRDPDQRPKDLLVVTELIRESLGKIERRRALSDRYGIPLRTTVPRPREARPRRLVRAAAVVGILLLLAGQLRRWFSPTQSASWFVVVNGQSKLAFWLVCRTLRQRRIHHAQWLNSLATLRLRLPPLCHRNR